MSSLGAAPAASARPVVPARGYETLWQGGVIALKVPFSARLGKFEAQGQSVRFLQFRRSVRGGCVNLFVHTTDQTLRGKTGTFEVSVIKKTLQDEREYLHVDLKPVAAPITCQFLVGDVGERYEGEDEANWQIFETPEPLRARLVFAPAGRRITVAERR